MGVNIILNPKVFCSNFYFNIQMELHYNYKVTVGCDIILGSKSSTHCIVRPNPFKLGPIIYMPPSLFSM